MKIIWLGHASFRIEIGGAVLLLDPFLDGNPAFPDERRGEAIGGSTHLLLTHGHADHAAEVPALAAELGVPVVGQVDLLDWWAEAHGIETIGFNKGGTVALADAAVTMVNAVHSATFKGGQHASGPVSAGSEAGYMIAGEGRTIYVSGDTDISADMEWMGELHRPEIGILNCGGFYTMDMERAAWAARRYFNFQTVIPSHYRTFPVLAQSAEPLRAALPGVDVRIPEVMETIEL